ncbi:HNH endonuclease [Streptomyces sp. NPDC058877]|uniref:HNH endonuclease n=1 Tax=Streptomyces sp. NPDC058877 TaxID=3346665 RepID=UPI0036B7F977
MGSSRSGRARAPRASVRERRAWRVDGSVGRGSERNGVPRLATLAPRPPLPRLPRPPLPVGAPGRCSTRSGLPLPATGQLVHGVPQHIAPGRPTPSPWTPAYTIRSDDHIKSVAESGAYTAENLQATHWICNIRKSHS